MGMKEIGLAVLAGFGGSVVVGLTMGKAQADKVAGATRLGTFRCAYDGMRFSGRDDLIDHMILWHRPSTPNDPRRDPSVLLVKLPPDNYLWDGMCSDGLGLVRIEKLGLMTDPYTGYTYPFFHFEQFSRDISHREPAWLPTWVSPDGNFVEVSSDNVNWESRIVYGRAYSKALQHIGDFFGLQNSSLPMYVRITALGIGPVRIWP